MLNTLLLNIEGDPTGYVDDPGMRCGLPLLYVFVQFLMIMLVGLVANLIVFVALLITAIKKRESGLILIGIIPLLNIMTLIKENNLPKWLTFIYIITMLPWILLTFIIFLSICISSLEKLNSFIQSVFV